MRLTRDRWAVLALVLTGVVLVVGAGLYLNRYSAWASGIRLGPPPTQPLPIQFYEIERNGKTYSCLPPDAAGMLECVEAK